MGETGGSGRAETSGDDATSSDDATSAGPSEGSESGDGGPDTGLDTGSEAGTSTGADTGDEEATDTGAVTSGGTGDSDGGATGLEGFCERYFECGGSYYSDVQDCMDASTNHWGSCPEALAALDAFGDCMITIPCDEYNPDAYNPANTICADPWSEVMQTSC